MTKPNTLTLDPNLNTEKRVVVTLCLDSDAYRILQEMRLLTGRQKSWLTSVAVRAYGKRCLPLLRKEYDGLCRPSPAAANEESGS